MDRRDPYRILQVHVEAEADVIRAAYRALARRLHPDKGSGVGLGAAAAQRMADLNWAYALLRDPQARGRWDLERRQRAPTTADQPRSHGAARPDPTYDASEARLDFGRYEGWTLGEVAKRDIEYLRWLSRHASGARHRTAIATLLRAHDSKRR